MPCSNKFCLAYHLAIKYGHKTKDEHNTSLCDWRLVRKTSLSNPANAIHYFKSWFLIIKSVCLTRIIQLVDTVRLDIDDETWSNVDVAMWNIVESHIGCVAANIPLMGPLFTRMRTIFKSPSYPYFSRYKNGASESLSTKNVPSQFGSKSRFSFRPRIAHANEDSSMDGLTENGITVTTDLEQTSHNTSPAPWWSISHPFNWSIPFLICSCKAWRSPWRCDMTQGGGRVHLQQINAP